MGKGLLSSGFVAALRGSGVERRGKDGEDAYVVVVRMDGEMLVVVRVYAAFLFLAFSVLLWWRPFFFLLG